MVMYPACQAASSAVISAGMRPPCPEILNTAKTNQMPNYYIDTEFHEGFHKPLFGRRRHFIDLISIAIVDEYERTYYTISKDFDVKAAWNAWQPGEGELTNFGMEKRYPKMYWLRENVLRPIWEQLVVRYRKDTKSGLVRHSFIQNIDANTFCLKGFKVLISTYGKSNSAIARDIVSFTMLGPHFPVKPRSDQAMAFQLTHTYKKMSEAKVFYGYYADYDWVLLCSLFGKMNDLPKQFPMYCRDLKHLLDDLAEKTYPFELDNSLEDRLRWFTGTFERDFPKQENEHDALSDARWNVKLHKFIKKIGG